MNTTIVEPTAIRAWAEGRTIHGEKKMKKVHVNNDLWVTVKVERGFPEEVKAFFTEKMALKQERIWRKQMNLDYDDTGVFKIKLSEINTSLQDRRG